MSYSMLIDAETLFDSTFDRVCKKTMNKLDPCILVLCSNEIVVMGRDMYIISTN